MPIGKCQYKYGKYQLNLYPILWRGAKVFPKCEVVSRDFRGMFRYNYGAMYERVCRLANVLENFGVKQGDVVGTLAWNTHRHLELLFAVPLIGAVIHPLMPIYTRDDYLHTMRIAEDKLIFVDEDLVPFIEMIKDDIPSVKHFIVMSDADKLPETKLSPVSFYEDLLSQASPQYDFDENLDEDLHCGLCFTSATTGKPKACLFTHRSRFLESLLVILPGIAQGSSELFTQYSCAMSMVPYFHVMGWCGPYGQTLIGAKQILGGPHPSIRDFLKLIQDEKVAFLAGITSFFTEIMQLVEEEKWDISSLKVAMMLGGTLPITQVEWYEKRGIRAVNGYGMTEVGPGATGAWPKMYMYWDWPDEKRYGVQTTLGIPAPMTLLKVVDDGGDEVSQDGKTPGEVHLKTPATIDGYYEDTEKSEECFKDGWVKTRDMATVDEEGYLRVYDRVQDIVRSGGEWISSQTLDEILMTHPGVFEAAVIPIAHPFYMERPLALVALKPKYQGGIAKEELVDFLKGKVAKFWVPDDFVFVDAIPKLASGRFDKRTLKKQYGEEYAQKFAQAWKEKKR